MLYRLAALRGRLTASSKLMLVVYPLFSCYVGGAYVLGDPARTATPSFDAMRREMPLHAWGWFFIALAVLEALAWALGSQRLMIVALCCGFGVSLCWAFGFAWSLAITTNASLTGPVIWCFVAVAHIASLRSLTQDTAAA